MIEFVLPDVTTDIGPRDPEHHHDDDGLEYTFTRDTNTEVRKGEEYLKSLIDESIDGRESEQLLTQLVSKLCKFYTNETNCLIIRGKGNNGKSIFSKIISAMITNSRSIDNKEVKIYDELEDTDSFPAVSSGRVIYVTNSLLDPEPEPENGKSCIILSRRFDERSRRSFSQEEINELASQIEAILILKEYMDKR